MSARVLVLIFALFATTDASAQGFAGLGATTEGYALPDPATRFSFPADHGPHPEFRIEWWYVTAALTGEDGRDYGIQWTLFRNALAPGGADESQAWMGHAAVATPEGHLFAERLSRGGTGQAGVTPAPFSAWIDEWEMAGTDLINLNVTAQGFDFSYDLKLRADGPLVSQGDNGYSVKSEAGEASHYYSQPFYIAEGTLTLPGGAVRVSGLGWLDREWSSAPLASNQTGWDWISLHLDTGEKLMVYRLRDDKGGTYTVGTWIGPDGTPDPLGPGELAMTPGATTSVTGRNVPINWQVTLAGRQLDIRLKAIYPDSWMATLVPYWEGPVRFDGSHTGVGYLEMSGYE